MAKEFLKNHLIFHIFHNINKIIFMQNISSSAFFIFMIDSYGRNSHNTVGWKWGKSATISASIHMIFFFTPNVNNTFWPTLFEIFLKEILKLPIEIFLNCNFCQILAYIVANNIAAENFKKNLKQLVRLVLETCWSVASCMRVIITY